MDPTHILAARSLPRRPRPDEVEAFYQTHGFNAFAFSRRLRALLGALRSPLQGRDEFVVRHAAE